MDKQSARRIVPSGAHLRIKYVYYQSFTRNSPLAWVVTLAPV